jgi:flagellar motility protein MotE (MotC chaperone)
MKKQLFILLLMFLPAVTFSQQYPKEVLPGKSYTVTATNDTLWVITDSQLEKCLEAGEKLEICKEITDSLKSANGKQQEVINQQDQNVKEYKEGYDRYKDKWEESDKKVEELEIKLEKQKKLTRVLCGVSAIGSALLTALIFIAL